MATRVTDLLFAGLDSTRYEPTPRRLRAELAGKTVLDSTAGMLVWEPGRLVPQYAVPLDDITADLVEAGPDEGNRSGPGLVPFSRGGPQMLTPATGFGVHSTAGTPLTVRTGDAERPGAAFRPADPDLAHLAILDFAAFDAWREEEEQVVSHPRDPFHRVDVRRSSRHVRVELDGHVLAESTRPSMVFETGLPVRHYLPPEDVDTSVLEPTATVTACAYKGIAAYRSVVLPERTVPDLVWTYADPLPDAVQITGLLCFFEERVDMIVDGVRHERPTSPWSANRQS
ncbi:MAG TPA: DUF427 domain-containing protein [Pseudonocardia sp.]